MRQVSSSDLDILPRCLSNAVRGPPMKLPEGLTRTRVADLLDELG